MSIEHCDNYSIYGGNTALMLNGVYASLGQNGAIVADPDGVSPGVVWQPFTAHFYGLRYILASGERIVGHAQRIWLANLAFDTSHGPNITTWLDGGGNQIAAVTVLPTGALKLTVNSPAGTPTATFQTSGPVITANGWWHIECKLDCGVTAGSGTFEIRVEGVTVLQETGLTFSAAATGPFVEQFVSMWEQSFNTVFEGGNPDTYYKDTVLWNGNGTQNIDFLGSVIVASLIPTSDVSLNWTPTPGTDTGATILATAPPVDASIYLDAPYPAPAAYKGLLSHLTGDITSVKCLMTMVRAAKVDGGDGSLQVGIISSPASAPATALGANRPITTAQTYWRDVIELDPKTAAPWLPSSVNVAEIQINRTT